MTNNIGHVIACNEAFNTPSGELILKQPINSIIALALPTYYSFVVAVGMINLKQQEYKTIVKVTSPSGKEIALNTMDFEIGPPTDGLTSSDGGFNVNFRNAIIEEEGNHIISVKLNDEEKTLIVPVIKKVI
ncbi:DUF6941 family protein [Planococcus alpniumensis]|uniref:DUF6941 family protein n=1 Tax=Planococcus alpniumensis TaxID=2708345 RepID=UPI001B8C51F9|nr:hypothetical protein [Planococcus sp. MSAK28401]